jgi:hypothetical protein
LPYRSNNRYGFRRIHRALAEATFEGRQITLKILENPILSDINARERALIRERRCNLNGRVRMTENTTNFDDAIVSALESFGSKPSRIIHNLRTARIKMDPIDVRPNLDRLVAEQKITLVLGLYCRPQDSAGVIEHHRHVLHVQQQKILSAPNGTPLLAADRQAALNACR